MSSIEIKCLGPVVQIKNAYNLGIKALPSDSLRKRRLLNPDDGSPHCNAAFTQE